MKQIFFLILIVIFSSCSTSKEYYENGMIEKTGKISNGQKNGKWKYYFKNGNFQGGGKYINGKRTGLWKWFHNNGELEQIGEFLNNEQNGEWKFYHDNGNQAGVGTLIHGKRIGKWTWYHTNGELYTEREWNDGKLTRIISCNDGQGKELDKGTFNNGNGTMKLYDIDGNLLETIRYENGEYIK